MKINNILLAMLGLAVIAPSCSVKELINEGEMPEGAIVRLTFSSDPLVQQQDEATRAMWEDSKGSGNLTFKWENVDIDSDETVKQALIVSDGTNPISVKVPSQEEPATFSGLAITPRENDAHYANFQTVGYYATDDLKHAKYCYAVTGAPVITEDANNKRHICQMPDMPATFTQAESQDPSFLKDYMYMYSTTPYSANGNTLTFKHIPATFRFIISNATDKAMPLDEIYMDLSHNTSTNSTTSTEIQDWEDGPTVLSQKAVSDGEIASKSSSVTFNWSDGTSSLSFDGDTYDKVSVSPKTGTTVAAGGKYTAYAMALPLTDKNAFNGKTVNFTIKSNGVEQIAFQLTGSRLAEINGSGIYNWVSGKSYTIRINIGADGQVTGEIILPDKDIVVRSNVNETYTLKYEDANGTPLADYADICTLDVIELDTYKDFINVNIAPREAETIGIYDSNGLRKGTILIADLKPDYSEEPLYRFGLLSDVHVGRAGINAETDFENVLDFFENKNTTMTCVCGDITQNGTEEEFVQYQNIISDESTIVYTTTGNHDCTSSHQGIDADIWQKYTGVPLVFEKSIDINGRVDHYLFLGMSYANYSAAYLEYHLNWLEDKLEAYRNDRCFVFTHLFFPDRAGNMNSLYPEANWLTGEQLSRLQQMCDHYVNSVWFSGHSHWEWSVQKYQDKANIYRGTNPTSGWCVHVPACGAPASSSTGNDRGENAGGSEGAVVEVYENHVDILGIALGADGAYRYQPIATYRLDTTLENIPESNIQRESHYLQAKHFHYYKGNGEFTITDVPDMPNYVDVIFSATSQGFYVRNETFAAGRSNSVSITVEDVMCWTNWDSSTNTGDRQVTPIENVGFYSGKYHLTSTNACYVNPTNGVQFQTSSSCKGPFNVKLRMKVQMVFSPSGDGEDDGVVTDGEYVRAEHFVQYKGETGKHPVVQLEDNYVQVTFNEFGSNTPGFFVANDTYSSIATNVSIMVEDVKALDTDGNIIDLPAGVGFWCQGEKYLLSNTTTAIVNNNYEKNGKIYYGVQFQISGSKYKDGPIPLTLKMKVRMQFYGDNGSGSGDGGDGGDPVISEYISAKDFSLNPDKNKDHKNMPTVADVAGTNYVDVTFYQGSQGFFIKPDNFPGKGGDVQIIVEEAFVILSNGSIDKVPQKVGFYTYRKYDDGTTDTNANYYLETITASNAWEDGLPFQTSSSCNPSAWPMTIRMKVKTVFTK